MLFIILTPLTFLIIEVLNSEFCNCYFVTSTAFSFVFMILFIFQFVFKKQYLSLVFTCHQKCDRSFKHTKRYFGICSRCFGIYVGIILSPFFSTLGINYLYYLFFAIPLIIDGLVQKNSSYLSNNYKRFITGLIFAPALISLVTLFNLIMIRITQTITNLII
jgi:uncharacterized membrane protein